jgi:hypothetical protein
LGLSILQRRKVNDMDLISRSQLRTLMEERGETCVSIYIPTSRVWPETQANTARLKNVISKAEEDLVEHGFRRPEVQDFLARVRGLLENEGFWRHPSDGLSVFLSKDGFDCYRLPLDFEELVFVGKRFHIKPLIPLFSNNGRFYVLAVSQNETRFLHGTRYRVSQIESKDLPDGINEVLKYVASERQLQFHTGTSNGAGQRAAMFHGQAVGRDDSKDRIMEYFRLIDDGVHEALREERAPLVFAGVDYLFPMYKEANSYPGLLDKAVEGNPEGLNDQELHDKAWGVVQPHFEQQQEEAIKRYREYKVAGKATNDLEDIIAAAHYGKIETLFVALDLQRWGVFEPDSNSVYIHREAQPEDYDLLDYAAVQTLLNGGTVYAVSLEDVPGRPPMAAVFRW